MARLYDGELIMVNVGVEGTLFSAALELDFDAI
jgi:hypothetical protein